MKPGLKKHLHERRMSRIARKVREDNSNRDIKIRLLRVSNVCALCGKPVLTMKEASVDHIVPLSRGGTTSPSNCQLAHVECNQRKGNTP